MSSVLSWGNLWKGGQIERPLSEPVLGDPAGRRVNLETVVVHSEELSSDQVGPGPGERVEDQGPGCCQPGEKVQGLMDRLLPGMEGLRPHTTEYVNEDLVRCIDRWLLVDHHRLPPAHYFPGPDDGLRSAVQLGTEPEVGETTPIEDPEDDREMELRAIGDQVASGDQQPTGMPGEDLVGLGVEVREVRGIGEDDIHRPGPHPCHTLVAVTADEGIPSWGVWRSGTGRPCSTPLPSVPVQSVLTPVRSARTVSLIALPAPVNR